MYKVFVNEKRLSISKSPLEMEKNIPFEGDTSFEIAIDLLENTSTSAINIFGNEDEIWKSFKSFLKIIEAAGGIVFNQEKKILFIHRLGRWDLPKGKIEPGESLEVAALREIEEETSLSEVTLEHFINTTYHIYKEKKNGKEVHILKMTHWFKMDYFGEKSPVPQVEEGITKVDWKSIAEIEHEVYPNTFNNIKLILSEVLEK